MAQPGDYGSTVLAAVSSRRNGRAADRNCGSLRYPADAERSLRGADLKVGATTPLQTPLQPTHRRGRWRPERRGGPRARPPEGGEVRGAHKGCPYDRTRTASAAFTIRHGQRQGPVARATEFVGPRPHRAARLIAHTRHGKSPRHKTGGYPPPGSASADVSGKKWGSVPVLPEGEALT